MISKVDTENQLPESPGSWRLLFPILAIVFVFLWLEMKYKLLSSKTSKSNIWKLYRVSNDTFSKWVKHFASGLIPHEEYVRKRQLTGIEVLILFATLGIPEEIALIIEIEPQPILRKREIVEKGEGSYRSLRSSVNEYPTEFLTSHEAFASLSKFPPTISAHLLEMYE